MRGSSAGWEGLQREFSSEKKFGKDGRTRARGCIYETGIYVQEKVLPGRSEGSEEKSLVSCLGSL